MKIGILSDLHLGFDRAAADLTRSAWASAVHAAHIGRTAPPGPDVSALAGCDLILAAGDIDIGTQGLLWLNALSRFADCPVVTVAGNHEFYDEVYPDLIDDLKITATSTRALAGHPPPAEAPVDQTGFVHGPLGRDGLFFLHRSGALLMAPARDRRRITTVAVLGATLWTDYRLYGDGLESAAKRMASRQVADHRRIRMGINTSWTPDCAQTEHALDVAWLTHAASAARAHADHMIVLIHHLPSTRSVPPRFR
jgi:hypothetical protein